MDKALTWLIVALLIIGVVVRWVKTDWDFVYTNPTTTGSNTIPSPITGINTTGDNVLALSGTIEGSFTYPSEFIPEDIYACAQAVDTQEEYCSYNVINDSKYIHGSGFIITVPAGEYYVYSSIERNPDYKWWYSESVPCGLEPTCPTDLIPVTVSAGQAVSHIDPSDRYTER